MQNNNLIKDLEVAKELAQLQLQEKMQPISRLQPISISKELMQPISILQPISRSSLRLDSEKLRLRLQEQDQEQDQEQELSLIYKQQLSLIREIKEIEEKLKLIQTKKESLQIKLSNTQEQIIKESQKQIPEPELASILPKYIQNLFKNKFINNIKYL
jgi:hypothetical protein